MVLDAFLLFFAKASKLLQFKELLLYGIWKKHSFTVLLKRNLEKIFSTKAKPLHIVQVNQDRCYVFSAMRAQNSVSKTLFSWN